MITLVVGGQYGGEGKGKIAAFLARRHRPEIVCRTGGINSKHTIVENGKQYDLRQIPTACAVGFNGKIVYGAGSLIHIPTLFEEMKLLKLKQSSIIIDHQTGIITDKIIQEQRIDTRYNEIGSTLTGTGYATAKRALRKLSLAREFPELQTMLGDTVLFLHNSLLKSKNVLVEGHQSAGLSNYHGDYPYTSNRDSTAAALLSELGIGMRHPLRIILTIKTFPTRNHRGRLPNELTVQEADSLGIKEYGGGSWGIKNNRRRVGRICLEDVQRSVYLNTPNEIALTCIDYVDPNSKKSKDWVTLSRQAKKLVSEIEQKTNIPITLISTGPETESTIYRNSTS